MISLKTLLSCIIISSLFVASTYSLAVHSSGHGGGGGHSGGHQSHSTFHTYNQNHHNQNHYNSYSQNPYNQNQYNATTYNATPYNSNRYNPNQYNQNYGNYYSNRYYRNNSPYYVGYAGGYYDTSPDVGPYIGAPDDDEEDGDAAPAPQSWVSTSDGEVPDGAVPNTDESSADGPTYFCEGSYNDVMYPGTLVPNDGCYVMTPDMSVPVLLRSYEVLVQ